jgi:hypothetical protein
MSRFVAAIRRTSTGIGRVEPSGVTSRSWIARRNFAWSESGISATSSRSSVPPAAARKTPSWSLTAPVKEPRRWPKSWLSRQRLREARAVDRHERRLRDRAPAVDRPRDELLAGAALARDQHGALRLAHRIDEPIDRLHGLARADELPDALEAPDLRAEARVLALERLEPQRALDRVEDLLGSRILDQVVGRAELHRLDGAHRSCRSRSAR